MDFSNILGNMAEKAKQAAGITDDDYIGEDGLLYCGKCHTRKQTRIQIFGREDTVYCLCKCQAEARDAEEAERQRRRRMERINEMRQAGFPDAEMQNWTFERDDQSNEQISKTARKYVEHFEEMKKRGQGLLFFGDVGTGKTFISACIANALIDKGFPCMVTNFARLVNTLSGMYEGKQEFIDNLNNFDLLVIDDLASERDTEYMGEIVQNIIDSRYRAGLPLIITTNLTSEELKRPLEIRKKRIYSRLLEMCIPIEVKGKDRRRQKLREEFNEIGNLLGIDVAERINKTKNEDKTP